MLTKNPARNLLSLLLVTPVIFLALASDPAVGQEKPELNIPEAARKTPEERSFKKKIQPLLEKYCLRCHNAKEMKSGIRVDRLDGTMENNRLFLWRGIREQVDEQAMPPEDELQPSGQERALLDGWIGQAMNAALARD
ncbi:MAG: c-type cytochrome domain-containing protein, partial [Pirellulaceae bacterium]